MNKMKTAVTALFTAALAITLAACATVRDGGSVPYVTADNFFFKNDATAPASPKITTQEDFYRLFGEATYMGKNGQAMRIDFNTKFVIAVVLPVTDHETDVRATKLTKDKGGLSLSYTISIGRQQTYTTRPVMLIVVDKKYDKGAVRLNPTTVINDYAS